MKKLATIFITGLMVVGLTTSAFAVGPVGQERGRDNRSYQSNNVQCGYQGRYEIGKKGYNGKFAHRWGNHDRHAYGWNHYGSHTHGWSHHERF